MIICSLFMQLTACINIAVGFENQGVCQNSDSMACRRWLEQVLNHVCLSGLRRPLNRSSGAWIKKY